MRTGPFSSPSIIEILNGRFVPVYAVNEDYAENGPEPAEEKREYLRIYREALDAGKPAGSVHVYVVDPKSGHPINSLHVADAADTERLEAFLTKIADDAGVGTGAPVVAPRPQSAPPDHSADDLVLHLVARPLTPQGSWDGTAENWVVYKSDEARRLLPAGPVREGTTWDVDPKLAARLLVHVYPVTENNDPAKNQIEDQRLSGRVVGKRDGAWVARLDGHLRMKHDFYHKPDGNVVETGLIGYVVFDEASSRILSLRLATDEGRYNGGKFGVAVREVGK
jgi:hypothetical protein